MTPEDATPVSLRALRARLESDPLLARGFRPFFLLAALHVTVGIPMWALMNTGALGVPVRFTPSLWHAHEIVFGFSAAAAAGVLLTLVPAWTGVAPLGGARLAGLVALWFVARIVVAAPPFLPPVLAAAIDFALPCGVLVAVGRPLLASATRRDVALVGALGALALALLGFHLATAGPWPGFGSPAARVAADALIVVAVVVGGRTVPGLTRDAPARCTHAWLERATPWSVWGVLLVDGLALDGPLAALPKLAATLLLGTRTIGGWTRRAGQDPLLWSLHLGLAWLPIGLALDAAGELGLAPETAGLHALGPGGLATLTLATLARVGLEHTGRPLVAPRGMALAFFALSGSAVLRTASTWPSPARPALLLASAALFCLAFATFLLRYGPMLIAARVDGEPG